MIGLLEEGDEIVIAPFENTINVCLSAEVITERKANWKAPNPKTEIGTL